MHHRLGRVRRILDRLLAILHDFFRIAVVQLVLKLHLFERGNLRQGLDGFGDDLAGVVGPIQVVIAVDQALIWLGIRWLLFLGGDEAGDRLFISANGFHGLAEANPALGELGEIVRELRRQVDGLGGEGVARRGVGRGGRLRAQQLPAIERAFHLVGVDLGQ